MEWRRPRRQVTSKIAAVRRRARARASALRNRSAAAAHRRVDRRAEQRRGNGAGDGWTAVLAVAHLQRDDPEQDHHWQRRDDGDARATDGDSERAAEVGLGAPELDERAEFQE